MLAIWIILIGYRGTGKTTVARLLAQRLGCGWVDADDEIERRAGTTITEIFKTQGEDAFRRLEVDVVAEIMQREPGVVSLGGGAVLREENRRAIPQRSIVFWLRARPATIQQRLHLDPATSDRRPALTSSGGLDEIHQVLQQRASIYESCADYTVDTDDKTPEQVVGEISSLLSTPSRG